MVDKTDEDEDRRAFAKDDLIDKLSEENATLREELAESKASIVRLNEFLTSTNRDLKAVVKMLDRKEGE